MSDVSRIRFCFYGMLLAGLAIILFGAVIVPLFPYFQADQINTSVADVNALDVNEKVVDALASGAAIRMGVAFVFGATLLILATIGLLSVKRIEDNLASSTSD